MTDTGIQPRFSACIRTFRWTSRFCWVQRVRRLDYCVEPAFHLPLFEPHACCDCTIGSDYISVYVKCLSDGCLREVVTILAQLILLPSDIPPGESAVSIKSEKLK